METTTQTKRAAGQNREWERNRRNKFNDAITKLGDIVKAINTAAAAKDGCNNEGNVKYAKIEIVQKAILCLTNCAEEKMQLKAEILALQVKLETVTKVKNPLKDASTQVYAELIRKSKKKKVPKLLVIQKTTIDGSKKNKLEKDTLRESLKPSQNLTIIKENKSDSKQNAVMPKLPAILPKKAQENTIVVLPAAPYLFPQRPLLLPSVPPAIVLLDSNVPTINKPVPIVSRNGDSTKTTMVNILPIAAYSRPLSATKQKKSNIKMKNDGSKKISKKTKQTVDKQKEIKKTDNRSKVIVKEIVDETISKQVDISKGDSKEIKTDNVNEVKCVITSKLEQQIKDKAAPSQEKVTEENAVNNNSVTTSVVKDSDLNQNKTSAPSQTADKLQSKENTTNKNDPVITSTSVLTDIKNNEEIKPTKIVEKTSATISDKDKLNKLPTILDDCAVDGGNARLELAEEFLAASPTAAFLMSFPLVSGNRADSPAEETHNSLSTAKDISQARNDIVTESAPTETFFDKSSVAEPKTKTSKSGQPTAENKQNGPITTAIANTVQKIAVPKITTVTTSIVTNDNPFLNLSMPSVISSSCNLTDNTFNLDFDCNLNKSISNQSTSYVSNSNIFYKNDTFSNVKNTIYSTSSITSNHEFNGLGLYPCAMEKYSSKNKNDYTNLDDKIGSSRLTYDIDLGWSHKGLDFVNCSTSTTTFGKDNMLTTMSSTTPFSTSYNPFNPEFHMPLVSTSNKKDSAAVKSNSTFVDAITSFYSQAPNLWSEEPFYTSATNVSKSINMPKHQNYLNLDNVQTGQVKQNNINKQFVKDQPDNIDTIKTTNNPNGPTINEKFNKKSPSKMHINWMTSEIRPMQNNFNHGQIGVKEPQKLTYNHLDHTSKRTETESNSYFPISMHNFPTQPTQEEFQVWPSSHRPLGTAEISIDPPPINLPTLVGDLALGPHDKKKHSDATNRIIPQQDLQNCSNFFSVTQLMNRSSDNVSSRYHNTQSDTKTNVPKQNISQYANDNNRKVITSRVETHLTQPYVFNDPKLTQSYDSMSQFPQAKTKSTSKSDKNSKTQKNNYSAEALLRGGNCSQKMQDHKFLMSQKYNDYNTTQDSSVAQVSHFPPILDYTENSYAGQQFSGTSLYNATTNTLSNSFYSNFMPGSGNLMSNYPSGAFTGEFIDYNQSAECNYTNHKYDELKMRNNAAVFQTEKVGSNFKSSRRDSAAKHKLECSKKDSSKKYQSKRPKLNNEGEDWNDPSHVALWQNKSSSKRHSNLISEDLPFPNYVGNQMASQYQPDFFNSHLMSSNMQAVSHNVDRSLASFPVTSRANFNLSTIFPEITMKVQ